MKKLIMLGMLSLMSLMSLVYAEPANKKLNSTIEIQNQLQEEVIIDAQQLNHNSVKPNNENFLYTFDFFQVGKSDKSVYKYVTNNLKTVATIKALEETMKKNWNLNSDYSRNLKLNSEDKIANNLLCKYNNGLVIKIKPYGNYSTNCPLKYML